MPDPGLVLPCDAALLILALLDQGPAQAPAGDACPRFAAGRAAQLLVLAKAVTTREGFPVEKYRVDDVYGMSRRRLPYSYVERDDVDARFINELGRDNHIVVYGSSKQGKTSLLLRSLQDDDYVVAQCSTDWTKEKLYSSVLKELDVLLTDSITRTNSRSSELAAEAEVEAGFHVLAKFRAKAGAKVAGQNADSVTEKSLPVDLTNAGDIIRVLDEIGYTKFIVVEDFHYLPVEIQKEFAGDLKAFYERSPVSFIIVGVWLEANRLIVYNGDLSHRLTSIPADTWRTGDLATVVRTGAPYLNAKFSDEVVTALAGRAQANVGQLQEATRQMFLGRNVFVTPDKPIVFDDANEVDRAYAYVAEQLAGRYANSINKFSEGLRDQTLHMYKWIMHAVISASPADRRAGLKTMDIVRHIQESHPKGNILPNNVMAALTNVSKVQTHADITPIIFDYDLTHKRLTIVDNGLHVYLEGTPTDVALSYLAVFANEDTTETPQLGGAASSIDRDRRG